VKPALFSANSEGACTSLGQPLTTLSGGERQRLKLATHMAEAAKVDAVVALTDGESLLVLEADPADHI